MKWGRANSANATDFAIYWVWAGSFIAKIDDPPPALHTNNKIADIRVHRNLHAPVKWR